MFVLPVCLEPPDPTTREDAGPQRRPKGLSFVDRSGLHKPRRSDRARGTGLPCDTCSVCKWVLLGT